METNDVASLLADAIAAVAKNPDDAVAKTNLGTLLRAHVVSKLPPPSASRGPSTS